MIAIIAPYDFSETTLAALRVAELAAFLGRDVTYLASGPCRRGVSTNWDTRVVSTRHVRTLWEGRPGRVVVFGLQPCAWLKCLDHLPERPAGDLVLNWCDAQEGSVASWDVFQRVISPSPGLHDAVARAVEAAKRAVKPVKLTWSAGAAGLDRPAIDGQLRVACTCDNGTLREHPEPWLHVVHDVLSQAPHASFSLQMTGSMPRAARRLLGQLKQQFPGRLESSGPMEHAANLAWLRRHHCFAYPAARAHFGLRVAQARAMGVPPVAFRVEPFTGQVRDGLDGWLVPCLQDDGLFGAARAVFDGGAWAAKLLHLSRNLSQVDEASARCAGNDQEFDLFWKATFSQP